MGPAHTDRINSKVFGAKTPYSEHLPNTWQQFMETYHQDMTQLGLRLLSLIGESLGLDPEFFPKAFTTPVSTLRLLHYYSRTDYIKGEIGAGAHTDYGGLTILLGFWGDALRIGLSDLRTLFVYHPRLRLILTLALRGPTPEAESCKLSGCASPVRSGGLDSLARLIVASCFSMPFARPY